MLSCISKRAAENVREEISFLDSDQGQPDGRRANGDHRNVRRMEGEGTIDLEDIRRKT